MGRPVWTTVLSAVERKMDEVEKAREKGVSLGEIEVLEGEIGTKNGFMRDIAYYIWYHIGGGFWSYLRQK